MVLAFVLINVIDFIYICFGAIAALVLIGMGLIYRIGNKWADEWSDE